MKLNSKQLAERLGISYVVSSGLIKLLVEQKQIEIAEKVTHPSGKGKPTRFYNFPEELIIAINQTISEVKEEEVVVAEAKRATKEVVPVMVSTCEAAAGGRPIVDAGMAEDICDSKPAEPEYWYDDDEDED